MQAPGEKHEIGLTWVLWQILTQRWHSHASQLVGPSPPSENASIVRRPQHTSHPGPGLAAALLVGELPPMGAATQRVPVSVRKCFYFPRAEASILEHQSRIEHIRRAVLVTADMPTFSMT